MKRRALAVAILGVAGCASYDQKVMAPWMGASESQLVQAWGYPVSNDDLVVIDQSTKVYTYRYNTSDAWSGAATTCRISFTLRNAIVSRWEYNGASCPRHTRP